MDIKFTATVNPRLRNIHQLLDLTVRDMRAMSNSIDVLFTKNELKLFATQGVSGGARWAALSPAYAKYKRRVRPGKKIMVFDGDLRKSLTRRTHTDHVSRWALKPSAYFEVGTRDRKVIYHPNRDALAHTTVQERGYTKIVKAKFREKKKRFIRVLRAWRLRGRS